MSVPTTSDGSRSGVNWMRLNCACSVSARALMVVVLARPGTPSSSTCPLESRPISRRWMRCCWPTTTLAICSKTGVRVPLTAAISSPSLSSSSRVMMIRSGTDGDVLGCAGQAQGDGTVAHRDRLGHAVDVVAIEFADGLDGNGDVMVDGLVGAFLG